MLNLTEETLLISHQKSPFERGIEKELLAIFWIYYWGFSFISVIDFLNGNKRAGLTKRLQKNGLLKLVEQKNNPRKKIIILTEEGIRKALIHQSHPLLSFQNNQEAEYVYEQNKERITNSLYHANLCQKIAAGCLPDKFDSIDTNFDLPVISINRKKHLMDNWWSLSGESPCDFSFDLDLSESKTGVVVITLPTKNFELDMLIARCIASLMIGRHDKIEFHTTSQLVANFYRTQFERNDYNLWLDDTLSVYVDESKLNDYPFTILSDSEIEAIRAEFKINNPELIRILEEHKTRLTKEALIAHDAFADTTELPTILGEYSLTKLIQDGEIVSFSAKTAHIFEYKDDYSGLLDPIHTAHEKIDFKHGADGLETKKIVSGRQLIKLPMPTNILDRVSFHVFSEPQTEQAEKQPRKKRTITLGSANVTRANILHVLDGKTTLERGQAKDKEALTWLFRWGWSTTNVLDSLARTVGRGLTNKLFKKGYIQAWDNPFGLRFYTLTKEGLAYSAYLNEDLVVKKYNSDPAQINRKLMKHDLIGQEITRDLYLNNELLSFKTGHELAGTVSQPHKFFDLTWVAELNFNDGKTRKNGRIGIEIELNRKAGTDLNDLITRCIRSLSDARFDAIFIYSDSLTIKKYRSEFVLENRVKRIVQEHFSNRLMTVENAFLLLRRVYFLDITKKDKKINDFLS
jgi:hypothetical protein